MEDNFGTLDFAEWQKVFRTNIFGPAKMADAFIDHVARGGEKLAVTVAPGLEDTGKVILYDGRAYPW